MDLIYGNESNSHLKILITSSKNEALLGHLARTGEIFGIEELIIPNIKSIELDSFKSISVTAERWLKIGGLNQDDRSSSITEALITNKSKGYQLIKLSKNKSCSSPLTASFRMSQKCLLILDECSCF
jgi:tRNA guanosine-2'-O-methyltransferase